MNKGRHRQDRKETEDHTVKPSVKQGIRLHAEPGEEVRNTVKNHMTPSMGTVQNTKT